MGFAGAVVAVHYGTDEASAVATIAEIRALGGAAFPLPSRFGAGTGAAPV
ncbi:hypothetical protein GCM10009838_23350 [Catenulispora subtropica]|uniref:Uncharacterized protein n=1 Tax=Catenulispora subtropica TaxID=450798 RepID=A0ABN2R8V7_9ACTN